ncbi:MAG: hypothetical protein K9M57_03230 [Phycisphaerae bacterium]|nr:hypothetical protein [Phycisphaerae bacterium]
MQVSLVLFKLMIPVIIVVKILQETALIGHFARYLEPVMDIAGLPGEMGIVWATTLLTNLYAGILVFIPLSSNLELTVAQVTVLTSMMLIAHALPIEIKIAHKAGVNFWFMLAFRFFGAIIYGVILNLILTRFGWLGHTTKIIWKGPVVEESWPGWVWGELTNLAMIFIIIFALLAIMKLLKWLKVTDLLQKTLHPFLRPLGIGHGATEITVIGMVLGLSYGGGLIIRQVNSGQITKKDTFFALAMMGLCHSLIEDTLLMLSIGGHWTGIFLGRIIFSIFIMLILVRLVKFKQNLKKDTV